jgi:YjbE family integral membrane protein
MFDYLGAVGGIVLVDLVLSGDNALVIGAAASGLPRQQRRYAILAGGAGAILLRIIFATAATFLLRLPLLQALGGVALIVIAVRLLLDRDAHSDEGHVSGDQSAAAGKGRSFTAALLTILVADVTMSLDNVLAVGALAHGDLPVLAFGLLLSIVLVLAGSTLVASLIKRLPWLLDVAALVLGWTAANMLLQDFHVGPILDAVPYTEFVVPVIGLGIVLVFDALLRLRDRQSRTIR